VVNIAFDMTRATLQRTRFICLGVVLALFCSVIRSQPVWAADDDEEEDTTGGDFKDPTIITDDSTSVPGVVLAPKEKKPIVDPLYSKWYFWAGTVAVLGAWIAFAILPTHLKAPTCGSATPHELGCIGDGR